MKKLSHIFGFLFLSAQIVAQTIIATDVTASRKLKVPATTSSAASTTGALAIDTDGNTTDITQSILSYYDGTRIMYGIFVDTIPTNDDYVLAYDGTAKKFVFQAQSGGGLSDGDKTDITVSGSGATWTIDNDVVTYAKMQNVSVASKLLGRGDSGSGDVQEITVGSGLTMTGTTLSASAGGGNVSNSGTPTAGQAAEWVTATTIKGVAVTGIGDFVKNDSAFILNSALTNPKTDLLEFEGSTSGFVTVTVPAAAGTHTIKLPTTTGAASSLLNTDGSGQWGWVSPYNTGVAEATVASATTTDLGAASSDKVSITGTTTITGFGTVAAGTFRQGRFTGALTLTHNATSLIVPGAANITTAAGDRFQAYSLGSGNWVVSSYTKADGTAVVGGGGGVSDGDKGDVTVSGSGATWTVDNDVVSNAKMANMAASTIKARVTGSTGDPEDATLSQVLDLVGSAANGDMLVRIGGSWGRLAAPTQLSGSQLYYGPSGVEWVNPATHFLIKSEFQLFEGNYLYGGLNSGGSQTQVTTESGAIGVVQLSTGTGINTYRHIYAGGAQNTFTLGRGRTIITWKGRLSALSDATDTYIAYVGLVDHVSTPVDGAWFEYSHGVNSGNWTCKVGNNSSITTANTSTAATTSWVTYTIDSNAGATEVKFYIDGTLVHTESGANIPGTSRASNVQIGITKTAGTTNARSIFVDYVDVYVKY